MAPISPSGAWFSSLRIVKRTFCSSFLAFSASANASTITVGASGLRSVSRSGEPTRWPMPRFNTCSSSCTRFSTTRMMLPVTTDSSIAVVSTSVSLVASTLEKSALGSLRPAIRSSMQDRSRFSNSAISGARPPMTTPRVSR